MKCQRCQGEIFNHTPGLKGHAYIAREVGCLNPNRGGAEFFSEGKGWAEIFYVARRRAKKNSRPLRGGQKKLMIANHKQRAPPPRKKLYLPNNFYPCIPYNNPL